MAKLHTILNQEKKDRVEKYFRFSTLGARFDSYTFDRFLMREGAEKAFEVALNFAETFDNQDCGLFIYGTPGNGKSHLAGAIAHYMKAKDCTVVFQSMPALLQRIRSTFNKNNQESEQEIMDILTSTKLLVIDDLGAEKVSGWVLDVLFRIIDGRYQKNLKTVITSNLKPTALEKHLIEDANDEESILKAKRLIDRILETSRVVHNQATSYRQEMALARMTHAG
jgi:DNA replication protein DnaC